MPIEADIFQQLQRSTAGMQGWPSISKHLDSCTSSRGVHLAVLVEPFLRYILEGRKTVESRFSKNCIAPYQRIERGDLVLLKAAAGPVVGCFTASWVQCMELTSDVLAAVRTKYSAAICADEEFWAARAEKRYVTLVGVDQPQVLPSVRVAKSDRRGWMVLRPTTPVGNQLSLL